MGSDAVSLNRVSRVVGYKITKGNFGTTTPNLPRKIAILSEANHANQSFLGTYTPKQYTSAQQAGIDFGFGSPIYQIMRILFPLNGSSLLGGIPVVIYPQTEAVGSTAKVISITPMGTATGNGTHTLVVSGRDNVDGVSYDINIQQGDTTAIINSKIADAINNVLGSPITASETDYVITATTKWKGLTANETNISIDTNGNSLGITYSIANVSSGSGTPSVAAALNLFGNDWITDVLNGYGDNTTVMSALEAFNGIPDPVNPTGRYAGIIMKPFVAYTGSTDEDPSSITDTRLNDVTIAICPAPLSKGYTFEAAANVIALYAPIAQNTPQTDVQGSTYPDMPTPNAIGAMSSYDNRDEIVQKGCSTVDLIVGRYVIQDFVTTYHPVGETPPQFRYVRNLTIDFNTRFAYYLLEQTYVVSHVIANDNDVVTADNVIKPKDWKQIVSSMADDLVKRALWVDAQFAIDSLVVNIGTTNPDRLETFFQYKRSGVVRIASTTAQAGFNFGTN